MRLLSDDALGALTVWLEARGESFTGKVAVAEVIRNRMRRRYASDGTVAGTVLRHQQFSGWDEDAGDIRHALALDDQDPVYRECLSAWRTAEHSDVVHGAVLYLNERLVHPLPAWFDPARVLARVGDHTFLAA